MKLTIIGLNYAPEPTGIAVYTTGLAEGIAERNPDSAVRVISGFPHYPQWRVYAGFTGMSTTESSPGLVVRRLRHYVPSKPRLINRLLMELHFGLRAVLSRWGHPDVVLLVSPALFSAGLATIRARLTRAPVSVWVQDIYSLGVSESGTGGSMSARMLWRVERSILRSANSVIVIHERFKRYLVDDMGIDPGRVEVVRNWSHLDDGPRVDRDAVRAARGWEPDDVIVLHAGNMGAKQGLENVVRAARIATERGSHVKFVLLGDGNQRPALEAMGATARLEYIDPLAEDDFVQTLSAADVLLVCERPGLTEMSVPSKLTSYFSTGVPVLAATDPSSVTAEEMTLSGGGVRVDAGDPAALLEAAESLAAEPAVGEQYTAAAREFSLKFLSTDSALSSFGGILRRQLKSAGRVGSARPSR
jgi:colanic acid biosynthesis glycosyl transferase WcaI